MPGSSPALRQKQEGAPAAGELLDKAAADAKILELILDTKNKLGVAVGSLKKIKEEFDDPRNAERFADSFRPNDLAEEGDRLLRELDELNAGLNKAMFEINLRAAEEKDRQKQKIN